MKVVRKLFFSFVLLFSAAAVADESYDFIGRHFVASYMECDLEALTDLEGLRDAMKDAVDASGATLLKSCDFVFPPDGLTMVLLLSESHASIHTYPEHASCFVDLFTCGTNCSAEKFDEVLQNYLKPKSIGKKMLHRGADAEELN